MNFLAQSPRSVILDNQSSTFHGLLSHSSMMTGIMSMTLEKSLSMPMPSSTFFLMATNQLSGVLSQHLKNSRQHGRRNATPQNTCHTNRLLSLRSRRSKNITTSLTKRSSMFWHLVSSTYMPLWLILMLLLVQFSTHIISFCILKWCGVVLKNRSWNLKPATPMPRTGMTRPQKLLRRPWWSTGRKWSHWQQVSCPPTHQTNTASTLLSQTLTMSARNIFCK